MPSIQTGVSIDAPRDRVFALFTDFRSLGDHISGIVRSEVLTDGPIGEGTRFRETRVMFGKEHTEEMWITGFEPGESYCVEAESCGSHYFTTFLFADDGAGTRVDVSFDSKPMTFGAKIMNAVMGRMMMKACLKLFSKDLDELKALAEGRGPTEEPSGNAVQLD